jgi:hypothetical protein
MKIRRGGVTRHVSERAFDTKFKQQGYEIVEEEVTEEELADKTVEELREIAKEEELTGYYKLNKDELIAKIEKVV